MAQNDSRKTLQILFEEEKYEYIYIPRIQRDYAQGRIDGEATVIRDNILDDVASRKPLSWGIIFGVSEERDLEDGSKKKCFIPIDGQQRLTTLYLLALYGEKKHSVPFGYLTGFNYETRSASRDFLSALVENWYGEKEEGEDLKEHILNQGWFLNYWALDPTVDAVLNMLNAIDSGFKESPEVFQNLDRISFEFLDLNSLNLNETLYLKMNSRGKKLSQFDRIKSEIDKILPDDVVENYDCCFSLYEDETSHLETLSTFAEKWRYCIDREWSNLFWDRTTHNFDIPLLAFLSNWLIVCAGEKYRYIDDLVALNYKNKDFFLPWKFFGGFLNDTNVKKYFEEIASLLNKLCHNHRNIEIVKELISIPTSYPQRALQFGLLSFQGNDYSSEEFKEWKRFIYNYSVNVVSDKESFFAFINRIRNDFASYSTNILPRLAILHEQKGNEPNMQLREEYFKAKILLHKSELSAMIREAEQHPMLNGRLRPLLVDGDNFDETGFAIIWSNFKKWFGDDGDALVFKEDDAGSLHKRSAFARAFTKQVVRQNQFFNDWRVLDFAAGTLKDRLQRDRFNKIFRSCLMSDNLDDIEKLECENENEIEFIQAKETLLQPGVIEGILKWSIGSRLRFRWYHNSRCLYPENGKNSGDRIGIDRLNDSPGWDRNRNHTLAYLQSKSYIIDAMPVSDDESVALWWGSDIRLYHSEYPDIILWWNEDYNLGIINKETYKWIKRREPIEGKNPNFMFGTVGMNEDEIEHEIDTLIKDYLEEQNEHLIERE